MDREHIDRNDVVKYFDIEDSEPTHEIVADLDRVIRSLRELNKSIDGIGKCIDEEDYKEVADDIAWESGELSNAIDLLEIFQELDLQPLFEIIIQRLDEDEIEDILQSKVADKLRGKK